VEGEEETPTTRGREEKEIHQNQISIARIVSNRPEGLPWCGGANPNHGILVRGAGAHVSARLIPYWADGRQVTWPGKTK